jgi:hypothetical protein
VNRRALAERELIAFPEKGEKDSKCGRGFADPSNMSSINAGSAISIQEICDFDALVGCSGRSLTIVGPVLSYGAVPI